ncbi:MAG: hypothetical protein GQ574_10120 [Crocinitomix sp.]|nr:hypothetical protein [Crocinitomix sp.]
MSEKFDIEELLREHLLDATEPSPPDLFAKIEAQVTGTGKPKRRSFLWFWFGTGLALITTGILFASYYGNERVNDRTALHEYSNETSGHDLSETASKNYSNERSTLNETDLLVDQSDSINGNEISNSHESSDNTTDAHANSLQTGSSDLEDKDKTNATNMLTASNNSDSGNKLNNTNGTANGDADANADPKNEDIKEPLNKPINNTTLQDQDIDPTQNQLANQIDNNNNNIENTNSENSENLVKNEGNDTNNLSNSTTIDTTLIDSHNADINNDSTLITEQNTTDSIPNPTEDLATEKDSIPTADITALPMAKPKTNSFGLLAYGGYLAFDQAVFKSYFRSGVLSESNFPSKGSEFALGVYYRLKNRFEFSMIGTYGQRHSNFNYDLMISESDFFDLYENDIEIPLENLDDPTSCNCFLAQDASLDYSIQTLGISFNASYDLIKKPKYSFGPLLAFGTVASTKFTNNGSSVIGFSPELKERFTGATLRMGLNFHYQITPRMQLGLAPSFNLQFAKQSNIYARKSQLLLVPLQLKWAL